jgi:hypothetical protein
MMSPVSTAKTPAEERTEAFTGYPETRFLTCLV